MNWKDKLLAEMNCTNHGGRLQGHALIDACRILDIQPKRIAEIGCYKGQTSRQLVHVFPDAEFLFVDPWQAQELPGKMYKPGATDWEKVYQDFCAEFAGHTIVRADSVTAAYMLAEGPQFDLVFIDGDHSYSAVRQDCVMWGSKVRQGGLLCGHDYSTQGANKGVKRAVDELLGDDLVVGSRKTWIHRIGGDYAE